VRRAKACGEILLGPWFGRGCPETLPIDVEIEVPREKRTGLLLFQYKMIRYNI